MRSTRQHLSLIPVSVLCLVVMGLPLSAGADRGTCSPRSLDINLSSRPPGTEYTDLVMAYEPAQRAIILWNGNEEILALSTDLSYRSPGVLTEVIPLPAQPVARVAHLELFSTLASIFERHRGLSTEWQPSAPEGVLSNLRVDQVTAVTQTSPGSSGKAIDPYSAIRPILSRYQARGIGWLVFDDIEIRDYVQSFPPVEYRFRSDKVYYPLEISTMDHGETRVDLFVITPDKLTTFSQTDYPVQQLASFPIDSAELKRLSPDWSTFMGSKSVVVQHLRMVGDIRKMTKDFTAR